METDNLLPTCGWTIPRCLGGLSHSTPVLHCDWTSHLVIVIIIIVGWEEGHTDLLCVQPYPPVIVIYILCVLPDP